MLCLHAHLAAMRCGHVCASVMPLQCCSALLVFAQPVSAAEEHRVLYMAVLCIGDCGVTWLW
jgi:hypothetical protein